MMKDTAHNAEYTKKRNRQHILQLLRRSPMSRISLAKETGLTRAAITLITREMIEEGFLVEGEVCARAAKGKSPIPLSVNPSACHAIGVSLTRSGCTVGIADFAGHVIEQRAVRVSAPDGTAQIEAEVRQLMKEHAAARILGVGISAPGPLDAERGVILNPPCFEAWHDAEIAPQLSASLGLPVHLEKDACVMALYHLDNGDSRDFLLLLVDSGIGSGVISDGRLLVSCGHYTSELGHTSILYNGKKCACGNLGCLEAYASIPNLLADNGSRYASWSEVIDAQDAALLELEADYLSAGIVNIRNLINIDTVYLAGDIRYGFEQLAPRLAGRVSAHSMLKAPIRILPSFHASDIGVAAAANLVFAKYLSHS